MSTAEGVTEAQSADQPKVRLPYYPDFYRSKDGDTVVMATCLRAKKDGVWYNTGFTLKHVDNDQGRLHTGQLAVVEFLQEAYRFGVILQSTPNIDGLHLDPLQVDEVIRLQPSQQSAISFE